MGSGARFDVIVIGGGLAGLATAHALVGRHVAVLEQEPRLGGRVLTLPRAESAVDLGACFAFNPALLPEPRDPPLERYEERGPIGVLAGGQVTFRASARELVALGRVDAEVLRRALFHQIHPGAMADYTPERQGDALVDWYPDHFRAGNGALVAAYGRAVNAEVRLAARVERVDEAEDDVRVQVRDSEGESELTASVVVIATPATTARRLVRPSTAGAAAFLDAVRYGRYTVVAFELTDCTLSPDFRFVVTPEARVSLVMQQASSDRRARTLLCYYDDAASAYADTLDDAALAASTRAELLPLRAHGVELERASCTVQRWALSGTVLGPEHAARYRPEYARATRRVFLAGDYLANTPGWGYGMDDAVSSGRATAALVTAALDAELAAG